MYRQLLAAAVFSLVGLLLLGLAFWIFDKLSPGKLWEEIVHKQNTALAITAAAFIIGMALIISASLHG